jgi:hypothetical protein
MAWLKVPAWHKVQTDWPPVGAYVPAGQEVHSVALPSTINIPAPQQNDNPFEPHLATAGSVQETDTHWASLAVPIISGVVPLYDLTLKISAEDNAFE